MLLLCAAILVACPRRAPRQQDAGAPDAVALPDARVGRCHEDPVALFSGQHQVTVSSLTIAGPGEGFDLDRDGSPDNRLALLGGLVNPLMADEFAAGRFGIPMELWGIDDPVDDDCVNFAVYAGRYPTNFDGDVYRIPVDCNDHDASAFPGLPEIPGDRHDNDCNGWADETHDASGGFTLSDDASDLDGDGYSPATGDCDDRRPSDWPDAPPFWDPARINKGQAEICGDGFDNDCDGVADEDCDPYDPTDGVDRMEVDSILLNDLGTEGLVIFRSAQIQGGRLMAGPAQFTANIAVDRDLTIELALTAAYLEADVRRDATGLHLTNAMLGGIIDGRNLDRAPAIAELGLGSPDNTMLDLLAGPVGELFGLANLSVCRQRDDPVGIVLPLQACAVPADCGDADAFVCQDLVVGDVDLDGDGPELYLDANLDGDPTVFRVDTCIDGDGTVVTDELAPDGTVLVHCSEAVDPGGAARFVDGFSIAARFTATPVRLYGTFDQ